MLSPRFTNEIGQSSCPAILNEAGVHDAKMRNIQGGTGRAMVSDVFVKGPRVSRVGSAVGILLSA